MPQQKKVLDLKKKRNPSSPEAARARALLIVAPAFAALLMAVATLLIALAHHL